MYVPFMQDSESPKAQAKLHCLGRCRFRFLFCRVCCSVFWLVLVVMVLFVVFFWRLEVVFKDGINLL